MNGGPPPTAPAPNSAPSPDTAVPEEDGWSTVSKPRKNNRGENNRGGSNAGQRAIAS